MKLRDLLELLSNLPLDARDKDIVLDDGYDGAWTNIFVMPIVEEFEIIGYTLAGDNQSVQEDKLPLEEE